jgi:hypothetical protein
MHVKATGGGAYKYAGAPLPRPGPALGPRPPACAPPHSGPRAAPAGRRRPPPCAVPHTHAARGVGGWGRARRAGPHSAAPAATPHSHRDL